MSKLTNETESPKIEYPTSEIVRVIPNSDEKPIKNIIIGITKPNKNYKIVRKNNTKYFLLECILGGKGYAKFNGKWEEIKKGDLLFFNYGDEQEYKSDYVEPFSKIFISFKCEYVSEMIKSYGIVSGLYKINFTSEYGNMLAIIEKENISENFYFYIAKFINDVIIGIASQAYTKNNTIIARIKNELTLSMYKSVKLEEIAKKINISKTTLIRVFKKSTNKTPYQYLLREKIRISKILLATTDKSVKEISYLLAFTDEHYFSYYFKKIEGETPSKYRKRKQN